MRKPFAIIFTVQNGGREERFAVTTEALVNEADAMQSALGWYNKNHRMIIKSIEIVPIYDEL